MHLGNLTSGQPFKAAWRVLVVFLLCYVVAGYLLVTAVKDTLKAELAAQTRAESLLLQDIYQRDGRAGLLDALRKMKQGVEPPEHMVGLLDKDGLNLAGPISSVPEFVGVVQRDVRQLTGGRVAGKFLLNIQKLENMTLVIGRNARFIETAGRRLTIGLVLFGGMLAVAALSLGLWASRTSLRRLREMETALYQVSEGDLHVRLPVQSQNDQFDRVAVRVNENLDRLERLVDGTKSTASAIAHDLKTPLSHTQIALNDAADTAEAGGNPLPKIETALSELQSLNTIFDTMLRISRIRATTDKSRFEEVNLHETAARVVEFMQPQAEEHGQNLHLSGGKVSAVVDAAMIQQALVNLIGNACIHAGKGAEISVATGMNTEGPFMSVCDNGPGIPDAEHEAVQEPFARLDRSRTTPGSGLGLALVRAIADHHGATLVLRDNRPGLCVEIRFPNFNKV